MARSNNFLKCWKLPGKVLVWTKFQEVIAPWPKKPKKQTNKIKTNNNNKKALRTPCITTWCLFHNIPFVQMKQTNHLMCFTQPGELFALSSAASDNPNRHKSSVNILVWVCMQEIISKPPKCKTTQVNELKIMTPLWVDFWLAFKFSRALIMARPYALQLCVIWLCMGRREWDRDWKSTKEGRKVRASLVMARQRLAWTPRAAATVAASQLLCC